jgi:hypothetical protein
MAWITRPANSQASTRRYNIVELANGQFAAYPNNRCRVYDTSLTPTEPLVPDFRVSTQYYQVEAEDGARYGDTDAYFYEEPSCEPK